MTDSHEQAYFLERFELVKDMLHDGDVESAVASLVDLREKGFVNKELDQRIDLLRADPSGDDVDEAAAWVEKVMASIRGYGGGVFEMVEELSEAAVGLSEADWVELEEVEGQSPLEEAPAEDDFGFDKLGDVDSVAEVDGFDDLDEFSDLEEFSQLEEFSDFDDLEGLSDLSEFEEFSDSSVSEQPEPSYDDAGDLADISDGEGDDAWQADEEVEPESEQASELDQGSAPSVDFAIIEESPSQVVQSLSDEEIEAAGNRFAEGEQGASDADSEDGRLQAVRDETSESEDGAAEVESEAIELTDLSDTAEPSGESGEAEESGGAEELGATQESVEAGESGTSSDVYELSEISEADALADDESNDSEDEAESERDAFDLDFGLDDMDFDVDRTAEQVAAADEDQERGVSKEILLEDAVDDEGASGEPPGRLSRDQEPTKKSEIPSDARATRKHQVPTRPGKESNAPAKASMDPHGNETKVAGLNERTSNRTSSESDGEPSDEIDRDAEFRETRQQQSVDPGAAARTKGEGGENTSEDGAPMGAADDGFQLFSDSEAEEMGLAYSSSEEDSGTDSVDPFDDDEELDPFENDLGENPFSDDDLFGDVEDEPSSDESGSSGARRMPESPSGEVRYRGAAPSPPQHRRGSSTPGDGGTDSGDALFDDLSEELSGESEASDSSSDNQFKREKTQRNESLAELASSMRNEEDARASTSDSGEDDDFDLGLTNPEDSRLKPAVSDEEDDFDLGLSNPEEKRLQPAASEEEDDFDLGLTNPEEKNAMSAEPEEDDFDLGLTNPEDKSQPSNVSAPSQPDLEGDGVAGPGSIVEESDADDESEEEGEGGASETFFGSLAPFQRDDSEAEEAPDTPSRHRQRDTTGSTPRIRFESTPSPAPKGVDRDRELEPTPASMSAVSGEEDLGADDSLDEDEFFNLAESLAQESEAQQGSRPKYRGEPMVGDSEAAQSKTAESGDSDNPFAHEAPTGVQEALRESESSFVLEEIPAEDDEDAGADVIIDEVERLFQKGKLESGLDLIESLLERAPEHEYAKDLKDTISNELAREYQKKLGSMEQTPSLKVGMGEIANLDLDSRAGFLLSQMDGMSSLSDLIELSNMSRAETLSVVIDLLERDIIELS